MSKPNFNNIMEFTQSTLEAFVKYNNFTINVVKQLLFSFVENGGQ